MWAKLRYFRDVYLRGLQVTFGRDRAQSARAVRYESLSIPGPLGSSGSEGVESPTLVSKFNMYNLSPPPNRNHSSLTNHQF